MLLSVMNMLISADERIKLDKEVSNIMTVLKIHEFLNSPEVPAEFSF